MAAPWMKYAENNVSFIKKALLKIRSNMGTTITEYKYDSRTIPNKPGIYVFWACFGDNGKEKYPVYLGKTEIGLKTRFGRHEAENGIIWMYKNNKFPIFPKQYPILKVWLLEMRTPAVMKFAESLFLASFDFPLNKHENGNIRQWIRNISQNTITKSYEIFNSVQDKMHKECALLRLSL